MLINSVLLGELRNEERKTGVIEYCLNF